MFAWAKVFKPLKKPTQLETLYCESRIWRCKYVIAQVFKIYENSANVPFKTLQASVLTTQEIFSLLPF